MNGSIAVIIPAYNEAATLGAVLQVVRSLVWPVIVVDDGSTDNTYQIAQQAGVHLLAHRSNLGKGAAMTTGAEYAFQHLGAAAIIFLDGDGQHDPQELPRFVELLENGEPVVLGVRQLGGAMPRSRILGNYLISLVNCWLFGVHIPDIPSGYKAFSREAYQQLDWEASGYQVEMEIAARLAVSGLSFGVVPIKTLYFDLQRGMNFLDSWQAIMHLLILRLRLRILRG